MKKFTDLAGREWRVSLNGWTLKAVKDGCNVLLTKLVEDNCKVLAAIHEDPLLLVTILWYMVEDQAEDQGVGQKDFAMALAGDVLFNAKSCLIEETIDFFDDPATRRNVRQIVDRTSELTKQIQAETEIRLGKALKEITPESVAKATTAYSGNTLGSAALSRGSTR